MNLQSYLQNSKFDHVCIPELNFIDAHSCLGKLKTEQTLFI